MPQTPMTAPSPGFAAAVVPTRVQARLTTSDGLHAGPVEVPSDGVLLPAYLARPQGRGPWPVVLVVCEIFGLHAHIADVARRFAHQGFLAVAPDLFVRQGDAKAYTDIPRLMSEVVRRTPDAQVLADLDACLEWALAQGGDPLRTGVTGFCWGGRITWLYAAHRPLGAGVAWYGRLVGESTALTPQHPVDVAPTLQTPVLGLYAGQDTGIALDTVDKMKRALASGGGPSRACRIHVYDDAEHAFHADYRPSYHPAAAEDAWHRCLAWFEAQGVWPA